MVLEKHNLITAAGGLCGRTGIKDKGCFPRTHAACAAAHFLVAASSTLLNSAPGTVV